jgi:hypothetical protein
MSGRRATLVAILSVVLMACSAEAQPTPSGQASPRSAASASAPVTESAPPTAVPAAPATPPPTLDPTPTPTPTPEPTAAPKAAKPTGVKFKYLSDVETKTGYRETFRVTWKTPRADGIEIRVYGVTRCLSEPKKPKAGTEGPCLVPHTKLPKSALTLIATAPASAGKVTWTWDTVDFRDVGDYIWRADPRPEGEQYYAVVVTARNVSGNSVFAIAWPGSWSNPVFSEGDMPC